MFLLLPCSTKDHTAYVQNLSAYLIFPCFFSVQLNELLAEVSADAVCVDVLTPIVGPSTGEAGSREDLLLACNFACAVASLTKLRN